MDVFVGSSSRHKVTAVEEVCTDLFQSEPNIQGLKATSDINEQPVGHEETLRGAKNRIQSIKTMIGTTRYDLLVAFEGGIFSVLVDDEELWFDIGWTVVEDADGNQAISHSAGIRYPTIDVKEAQRRGFETTTVGAVMSEHLQVDPTNPQSALTSQIMQRSDLSSQSLKLAIGQLLTKSEKLRDLRKV